jgi:hypothetical protein
MGEIEVKPGEPHEERAMKMSQSKFRRLEEMSLRVMNKTDVVKDPKNRAERRALERFNRRKKIRPQ